MIRVFSGNCCGEACFDGTIEGLTAERQLFVVWTFFPTALRCSKWSTTSAHNELISCVPIYTGKVKHMFLLMQHMQKQPKTKQKKQAKHQIHPKNNKNTTKNKLIQQIYTAWRRDGSGYPSCTLRLWWAESLQWGPLVGLRSFSRNQRTAGTPVHHQKPCFWYQNSSQTLFLVPKKTKWLGVLGWTTMLFNAFCRYWKVLDGIKGSVPWVILAWPLFQSAWHVLIWRQCILFCLPVPSTYTNEFSKICGQPLCWSTSKVGHSLPMEDQQTQT